MIEYKIIRSGRTTAGIYVLRDGQVEVRCPRHTSAAWVENFVKQKEEWIIQKVDEKKAELAKRSDCTLTDGSMLLFLGAEYPLLLSDEKRVGFDTERFYCFRESENRKALLIDVYRKLAEQVLTEKVQQFSEVMGCTPLQVKINAAKTRWGSCSGKDSLNFSYKLVMACESAIDYVVVHELAHIREHNHSARFWAIVSEVLPDYKKEQMVLKELQERLLQDGWER